MKKKACILACLLIGATVGGGLEQRSIANPAVFDSKTQAADISEPGGDLSNLVLTLQDLPPGFTELSSVATLKNKLQNSGLKAESVFAYQNSDDKEFQLLMGFTIQLPNRIDRARFDADIREGNLAKEFSKSFSSDRELEFTNVTPLTLQDNIGEISAGWTTQGKIRSIPMNVDMTLFRRGKIGVFMAILYLDGPKQTLTISEAARKFDGRMMELKPDLTKSQ